MYISRRSAEAWKDSGLNIRPPRASQRYAPIDREAALQVKKAYDNRNQWYDRKATLITTIPVEMQKNVEGMLDKMGIPVKARACRPSARNPNANRYIQLVPKI